LSEILGEAHLRRKPGRSDVGRFVRELEVDQDFPDRGDFEDGSDGFEVVTPAAGAMFQNSTLKYLRKCSVGRSWRLGNQPAEKRPPDYNKHGLSVEL
jgi:hypothetical protein